MEYGEEERKKVVYFKIVAGKENRNDPYFLVKEKKGNEYVTDTCHYIKGWLIGIEQGSYIWEGDTIETVKYTFQSKNGLGVLTCSYTSLSRSIINYLVAAAEGNIGIVSLTLAPGKDDFPSLFMKNNEKNLKWAYKYEDFRDIIREVDHPTKEGKKIKVYDELNEWFKDNLFNVVVPALKPYSDALAIEPEPTEEEVLVGTIEKPQSALEKRVDAKEENWGDQLNPEKTEEEPEPGSDAHQLKHHGKIEGMTEEEREEAGNIDKTDDLPF